VSRQAAGAADVHRGVVIGSSAVGGAIAEFLLKFGYHVEVVDTVAALAAHYLPQGGGIRGVPGDITAPDPALIARIGTASTVVLAVPEHVALAALDSVVAAMADGALLVDTLPVKSRFVPAAQAAAPHLEMVSVNPMLALPLGMAGRPVAVVVAHDGPRARDLLSMIRAWGCRVVPLTAAGHDRATAAVQVLPHAAVLAFGLALEGLGADAAELEALAPPPYRALLALLARIISGVPEAYWDVQSANPAGEHARDQLADALRRLADIVESGDHAGFDAALQRLRGFLGPGLGHYREVCARVFVTMDRARDHG
jgi:4-amino-4-deoxyprephenate dehydrogenase